MPDEGGCFRRRTRGCSCRRTLQNAVVNDESYILIFDVSFQLISFV